eukprot:gene2018-biopygen3522
MCAIQDKRGGCAGAPAPECQQTHLIRSPAVQQVKGECWAGGSVGAAWGWFYSVRCSQRKPVYAHVKQKTTGNEALDSAIQTGVGLVESAANLVPESVPRPIAKGGVAVAGALLAFWALQKARHCTTLETGLHSACCIALHVYFLAQLVSTVLTIALLGGAAWFYFQYAGSSKGTSSSSSSSSSRSGDPQADLDDPLAEARRIMDKYKK